MQNQQTAEQRTGELVRHRRIACGYSQQELADAMSKLGLSWHQTTVAKTEAAERPIRVNELVALARVLDVPASTLVQESQEHAGGRHLVELLRARNRVSETQEAAERAVEAHKAAKERFDTVQAAYLAGVRERNERTAGAARVAGEEEESVELVLGPETILQVDIASASPAAPAQGDKEAGNDEHQ